jgi:hypothetical protein
VVLEVGVFAEPPVADVALEWPGPVVNVHVRLEVPWRREGLGAQTALVGLLLQQTHTPSTRPAHRNFLYLTPSMLSTIYNV